MAKNIITYIKISLYFFFIKNLDFLYPTCGIIKLIFNSYLILLSKNKFTVKIKIKNMRLLIIEDDKELSCLLSTALKPLAYAVDTAEDGEKGLNLALINSYDLIITDYNLPLLNGREIIERIRNEKRSTPILVLSVRSEINDRVELLNLGADDYLAKPFTLAELLARIKALLRRPQNIKNKILTIGDLEMQPDRFLITKSGKKISLSSKEFALLQYLIENKGEILSRQKIMEHVWDENADPFSNTIEVHIMNLRKKIETTKRAMIFTYSNRGYKIDVEK